MSHVEEKVFTIELVDDTKASLREAMRAACLHEDAMAKLNKAGDSIAGVLIRTAKEVYTKAHADAKANGIAPPSGEVVRVLFEEAIHDEEVRVKDESSAFKHLKKLPRAWSTAKSQLCLYLEYDEVDWDEHTGKTKIEKFNKEMKAARAEAEAAKFRKDTGQKPEVVADNTDKGNDNPAQIDVSKTKTKDVTIIPGEADDTADAEVVALLNHINELAMQAPKEKVLGMLKTYEQQLNGVVKKAMGKIAKAS